MKKQLFLMILTTVIILAVVTSVQGNTAPVQNSRPENPLPVISTQQQTGIKFPRSETYWTEVKTPTPRVKQGPAVTGVTTIQAIPAEPKPSKQPSIDPNPQSPPRSVWGMEHSMGHGWWNKDGGMMGN